MGRHTTITSATGRILVCDTPDLFAKIVDGVVEVWEPRDPNAHVELPPVDVGDCGPCDKGKSAKKTVTAIASPFEYDTEAIDNEFEDK
jgi:hypothetical protein